MLVTFSMLSTPEAHERHTRWAPTIEEGSIRQQLSTLSAGATDVYFFDPATAFPPPQCGIAPLIRISTRRPAPTQPKTVAPDPGSSIDGHMLEPMQQSVYGALQGVADNKKPQR
jgi:hypothetical protein